MATVTIAPTRPRRFFELLLLLLTLTVGTGGYALTSISKTGALPTNLLRHIGTLLAISLITKPGIRFLAPYSDPVILPIAVALTSLGPVMIYRLDQFCQQLDQAIVGMRQLMFVGVAVILAAIVLVPVKGHHRLRSFTYTFGFLSLLLPLPPMVPGLGVETYGARMWIRVAGVSFQPGELVKITLAIFFAGYLVRSRDNLATGGRKSLGMRLPRAHDLGPTLMVWLIGILILVLQRGLGTSLLFFGLFVTILYVVTNRIPWLVIDFAVFAPAVLVAVRVFPHVANRFHVWLHALDGDVYTQVGGSYQLVQSFFRQASDGLVRTRWRWGYPQFAPLANSNFILFSLAEELGLTGLLAILVLYLILIKHDLRTATSVRSGSRKLLATGLSFSLAIQVFVVLEGITRLIPLMDLTAPFLVASGSSMVSSWLTIALLLRLSDTARRPSAASPAPWNSDIHPSLEAAEASE